MIHVPVLPKEVLENLDPRQNENFVDGTVGHGGHAKLILEKTGPEGKLLGIDQDPKQIEICREQLKGFKERVTLANGSYINLKKITEDNNFKPVNGILLDLGMSSWHLEESGRGFSFLKSEPLDMRYNPNDELETAEEIVNRWNEDDLESILREYGEERFSRMIARRIVEERKVARITDTLQLIEVVKRAMPKRFQGGRINPATRTFQALRIQVNQELENLKMVLPEAIQILAPQGRLVVISFHSLEDRIVKNFFRERAKEGGIKIITKKPLIASIEEQSQNPRSRSAKLRAVIKNN